MSSPIEPTPTPATSPPTFPIDSQPLDAGEDSNQFADADDSTPRNDDDDSIEDGAPDSVEIGDPVPEEDRTVRADQSEEALPGDDDTTNVDPDPDPSQERH